MTDKSLSTFDAKLQMVRMLIHDIETDEKDPDDSTDLFHDILRVYERLLVRTTSKRETTAAEVLEMQEAVDAGHLLVADLFEQEAEHLAGWHRDAIPTNHAMAAVNLISRLTEELGNAVRSFRFKYPELNPIMDRRLIQ